MKKKEMFENGIALYRSDDSLEELDSGINHRKLFWDEETGDKYFLNDMSIMKPIELLYNKNLDKFFNMKKFEDFLDNIDFRLTQSINEIIVITGDEEISYLEHEYGRELLESTVGQAAIDEKFIVVNLRYIISSIPDGNINDYINNILYNFLTTLFHELAHINVSQDILPPEYNIVGDDNEDDVEAFAINLFDEIDATGIDWKFFKEELADGYMNLGEELFSDEYSEILSESL